MFQNRLFENDLAGLKTFFRMAAQRGRCPLSMGEWVGEFTSPCIIGEFTDQFIGEG